MKRIIASLLLFVFSFPAFGWGLLYYMDRYPNTAEPGYKGFLLYRLMQNNTKGVATVKVCVDVETGASYSKDPNSKDRVASFLYQTTQEAFDTWLNGTLQGLKPRAKEFADVLNVLPSKVKLEWVNQKGPHGTGHDCKDLAYDMLIMGQDVDVIYGNKKTEPGLASPYNKAENEWYIMIPANDRLAKELYDNDPAVQENSQEIRFISSAYIYRTQQVAIHEVGHMLGLADLYDMTRYGNNMDLPLNGTTKTNSHLKYSLYQLEGAKFFQTNSAMRELNGGSFSCDDMDGLINAADFVLRSEGKVSSKRLQHGWGSLCNRGYLYVNGEPLQVTLQQKDAFQTWVNKGYKEADKPSFVQSVSQQQQQTAQDLADYLASFDQLETEYRDLETKIDSLKLEIQYSKLDATTKKQKQEEMAALQARLEELKPIYQELMKDDRRNAARYSGQVSPDTMAWVDKYKKMSSAPSSTPVIDTSKPLVPVTMKDPQKQPVRLLPKGLGSGGPLPVSGSLTQGRRPQLDVKYTPTPGPVSTGSVPVFPQNRSLVKAGQDVPSVYRTPQVPQWEAALPDQTLASASDNALSAQPKAAKPKVCDVCGRPVEGSDYYTDSVGRHVHKGGECAYKYFARFHKTDAESLTSYDDYYLLHTPQAVSQAKSTMKNLGITTAGIRAYQSDMTAKNTAIRQRQLIETGVRSATQNAIDQACSFYRVVSKADLDNYIKDNSQILNSATRKRKAGERMTQKEEKTLNTYYTLFEDYKTTQFCQNMEKKK